MGRIYQQTFIDTYSKVAFAKLYDRKTPITAADLLNDRVLPFFEEHEIVLSRVLTAIGERSTVGATAMNTNYTWRFYRVAFRKKIYKTLEELQTDLEAWLKRYNEERPHQGRWCYGKTPMQTFVDRIPLAKEKMIAA